MPPDSFSLLCQAHGLPAPEREFVFASPRLFRFDWAWPLPLHLVAVEQEGGFYGRGTSCPLCGRRRVGAHTSIERLKSDKTKYNLAASLGWRVLRFTPQEVRAGEPVRWLQGLLLGEAGR